MRILNLLLISSVFILLVGCANYKLNYAPETQVTNTPIPPKEKPNYSVYLIGDAGNASEDWTPPALKALKADLESENERSAVVFLGNNVPSQGMPPKSEVEERRMSETALDLQLNVCKDFAGRIFFVAGNHDWYEYNIGGVKRQSKYLARVSGETTELLPRPGCGDPIEVELTDTITLLLLDSQWWMENWSNDPDINDGCTVKSRLDFDYFLREAMKGNSRKELLVALHHPLFTNGPHGGKHSALNHLFPLRTRNKKLWVPLPVIGSVLLGIQSTVGTRQDVAHANYRLFKNIAITHAKTTGEVIFASGHEHSLQYWQKEGQHFIVSGSGSEYSETKTGSGALFAYGHYGYSRLNYYEDGQVWVQYFSTPEGADKEMVFEWQIKKSRVERGATAHDNYPDEFTTEKRRTAPISQSDFSRSKGGETFWGAHYRAAYADDIEVRDLDLEAENLRVVKRGGGFQTNSLRLEDRSTKRQYTLRSIDKDASRTVPNELNTEVVRNIVSDNFSASHPLAALVVPKMASAIGVYHAQPELVYLPQQQALGSFNPDFSNAMYLLEGRPNSDKWQTAENFGKPRDVMSTYDMIEKVRSDNDKEIDQEWTLLTRLFDMTICDWDRHDDQWRWAERKEDGLKTYRPIPRDRDQAFANYDGLVFVPVRNANAMSRQWRPLTDEVPRPKWAFYNGLLFDQSFLTEMDWSDWESQIKHLQQHLTDEIIESAFSENWPEPFLSRDAPRIIEVIKGRRDNLLDIAKSYYEHLATNVDVLATDKKDLFLIDRLDNERTRVRVYDSNHNRERQRLTYDRIFLHQETKHIYCYGLGDDDVFEVRGDVNRGSIVQLIGGEGKDVFDDQSYTRKQNRRVHIFDLSKEDSQLENTNDSKDRRSIHPESNLYSRKGSHYKPNFLSMWPALGFNPDDKLFLGLTGNYTRYGKRKEPYSSHHSFNSIVSLDNGGAQLAYQGDFAQVIGLWGLRVGIAGQTPLYASNFYGLGNETKNLEEERMLEYHRVRREHFHANVQLRWAITPQFSFFIGPRFHRYRIELREGTLLNDINNELDPENFETLSFADINTRLEYSNVDQQAFPTSGLKFDLDLSQYQLLNDGDFDFMSLNSKLSFYTQIENKGRLVLATQLGFQHRISDDFPFYLGAELSGAGPDANFRGFRRNRFLGQTAFHHNTDLRWKIGTARNRLMSFDYGITGSFDYGRVWLETDYSDRLHHSYGGGAFITPFGIMTIHVGGYLGDDEDWRFLAGTNFFF